MLSVTQMPRPYGVHTSHKLKTKNSIKIKKDDRNMNLQEIRSYYAMVGLLEGQFRLFGKYECEGNLNMSIKNSSYDFSGELLTYNEQAEQLLYDLFDQIQAVASVIAYSYDGKYSITVTFTQTVDRVSLRAINN